MDSTPALPTPPSTDETPDGAGPSRRALFGAAGLGAAGVLAPLVFTGAATAAPATPAPAGPKKPHGHTETHTLTGSFSPGAPDYAYLPLEVPRGANRIDVSYSYDAPEVPEGTPGNSCDIGIFDQHGVRSGGKGFRGWSGGSRTEFFVTANEATPGYLPGRIDRGTWHVVLAPYQVAPAGLDYEVTVTLTYGRSGRTPELTPPPTRAPGRGRDWYRGDCHLHTVHSDGKRTPEQVAAAARERGLDFLGSTDHNTSSAHGAWADAASEDLLVILGEEVTTRQGHWVALGLEPGRFIDWRYRVRDDELGTYTRRVRRDGGLAISAHMYCPWIGCEWKFGFEDVDVTEVWTGPWGWDDEAAVSTWANMLAASAEDGTDWLPAMGNSDAHSEKDVVGLPMNVVLADGLDRASLLEGLRTGRTWIAESADIDLEVHLSTDRRRAGIGERLSARKDAEVTARVEVSGVPHGTVRILTDQGQMMQQALPASGTGTVTWTTTPQASGLVRIEVRHPLANGGAGGTGMDKLLNFGSMAALTNPIWIDQHR